MCARMCDRMPSCWVHRLGRCRNTGSCTGGNRGGQWRTLRCCVRFASYRAGNFRVIFFRPGEPILRWKRHAPAVSGHFQLCANLEQFANGARTLNPGDSGADIPGLAVGVGVRDLHVDKAVFRDVVLGLVAAAVAINQQRGRALAKRLAQRVLASHRQGNGLNNARAAAPLCARFVFRTLKMLYHNDTSPHATLQPCKVERRIAPCQGKRPCRPVPAYESVNAALECFQDARFGKIEEFQRRSALGDGLEAPAPSSEWPVNHSFISRATHSGPTRKYTGP